MRAMEVLTRSARFSAFLAPLLILNVAAVPLALADGVPGAHARAAPAREANHDLRVPLDQAVAVHLPAAAGGVAVGNPSIAGVSVQNERMLFITGRSYGSTNLVVVDDDGRTIYSGRVTVTSDETNAVMVTRGNQTARLDCTPQCRPRPDIGDGSDSFNGANAQITTHAAAANSH